MPRTRRERVLQRVELKPDHQPRGQVDHFMEGGRPMPRPTALEIVKRQDQDTCYLVYLDDSGAPMTQTWHPSPAAAALHAKWAWGIEPDEWAVLSEA